ncbi:amino acid adenylation domain-containing protein [Nonomuraea sp. K274]|uniref:Amino acid adenylation domain-containing protein n=1 Tax=Nonomuraea cypriaca TaxID=1187855 RepID=A0A931A8P6_9ACTN|nr:amino acid adenylation domain-containing protein [Nonomuraea cypriaca]MBF8187050.1 amino acid adenylation domain-containing protein [Nonomuraea cypriaca]
MSTSSDFSSLVGLTVRQDRVWSAVHATAGRVPPQVRALRIDGRIEPQALADAITLGAADPVEFRTTLVATVTGDPLLLVGPPSPPALAPVTRGDDIGAMIRQEIDRPFGPTEPILSRLRLFQTGPRSALVLIVLHPMIADDTVADGLAARIADAIIGRPIEPSTPSIPSTSEAREEVGEVQVSTVLPLGSARAGSALLTLPADARAGLAKRAHGYGVSTVDLAGAVLTTVVARWLRRGSVILARPDAGWIGMSVIDHVPGATVDSAVREAARAVTTMKDALPHADAVLVGHREWVRRTSPTLTVTTELVPHTRQQAAVELVLAEGDELHAMLSARDDLMPEHRVRRMADSLGRCLTAVADGEVDTIDELPVASTDDAHRTLAFAGGATTPEAPDLLLNQLFERQAARTPDAPAVFAERELSYRELDAEAERLADCLVAEGVRPGALVALSMRRSSRLLAASLAVLKAGAAYMPLVTELPSERLALIVSDADPQLIITEEGQDRTFPERLTDRLRDFDALLAGSAPARPMVEAHPEDLAYMVYTSGSTGRPKGVMVRHRSLVSRIVTDSYEPTRAGERYLLTTAPSFMDSNWEIFTPLSSGGAIVIPTDDEMRDAWRLVELAVTHRVERLLIVPSLLAAIIDLPEAVVASLRGVRLCLCSGEPLPQTVLDRVGRLLPDTRVINLYGLSETWDVCWADVSRIGMAKVIGRPMPHAELYVLDDDLGQPPLGALGELYVGGNGLARGYLRRPTQTVERFVPNPYGPPGSRLYRTGDLVRWLDDGNLEFVGRLDRQVKIRGFRLELDEVEAALRSILGCEAVVIFEQSRLVAYLAAPPQRRIDGRERRQLLGPHLPDYMIPSVVVWLDEFPLTANGKINRLALPSPATRLAPAYRPARSDLERYLLRVVQRQLRLDDLGIDDELDSALLGVRGAVRLQADITSATGAEVPVADLLANPTIARIAARLEG